MMMTNKSKNKVSLEEKKQEWTQALKSFGYMPQQIERMLSQKSPTFTINALILHHSSLIKKFTHEEIVEICSAGTGKRNIEFIISPMFEEIINHLDMTTQQVVKIFKKASCLVFEKLHEVKDYLIAHGYTKAMLCTIGAHHGGSVSISFLLDNLTRIEKYKLEPKFVVKYLEKNGGHIRLSEHLNFLEVKYENKPLISAGAESKYFDELDEYKRQMTIANLINFGYEEQQIYEIFNGIPSDKHDDNVIHLIGLISCGFTANGIYAIFKNNDLKDFSIVLHCFVMLSSVGFNSKQIERILRYNNPVSIMADILSIEILAYRFHPDEITNIIGFEGGNKNIEFLKKNVREVVTLDISNEELAVNLGSRKKYKKYRDMLQARVNAIKPQVVIKAASDDFVHYPSHNNHDDFEMKSSFSFPMGKPISDPLLFLNDDQQDEQPIPPSFCENNSDIEKNPNMLFYFNPHAQPSKKAKIDPFNTMLDVVEPSKDVLDLMGDELEFKNATAFNFPEQRDEMHFLSQNPYVFIPLHRDHSVESLDPDGIKKMTDEDFERMLNGPS